MLLMIPTIILSFVMKVASLFGFGTKREKARPHADSGRRNGRDQWNSREAKPDGGKKKVLFDKDEGEYVDFEEIKD